MLVIGALFLLLWLFAACCVAYCLVVGYKPAIVRRHHGETFDSPEVGLINQDEPPLPEYQERSIAVQTRLPLCTAATFICVKTFCGKRHYLSAKTNDTVSSLKSQIQAKVRLPDSYKFLYAGRILEETSTLEECRIYDGATLCLIPICKKGGVQIFVRTLKGNTMAFFVWPKHNTVNDLKLGYMFRGGIDLTHHNFDLLRLVFRQKQLDYRYTLRHYGIRAESTINLVLSLPGGFDGLDQPPPSYGTFENTFGLSPLSRPSTRSSMNISELGLDIGLDNTATPSPQYVSPARLWLASPEEQALSYRRLEATLLSNTQDEQNLLYLAEETLPAYQLEQSTAENDAMTSQIDGSGSPNHSVVSLQDLLLMEEYTLVQSNSAATMTSVDEKKLPVSTSTSATSSPEPDDSGDSPPIFPEKICCKVQSCTREFSTRSALNHHMRYHTKLHQCPICTRSFGTVTHQKRHMNAVHQTVQKYHCPVQDCRYSSGKSKFFSRKDNWRRHMLSHQSENGSVG